MTRPAVKKQSIRLITLGCSKNLVDSEKILGQLPPGRYHMEHEGSGPADILIINTCSFIGDARQESIDTILEAVEAKRQGLAREVLVTGCLPERYRVELEAEIPEVDAWFGARGADGLFAYLGEPYRAGRTERILATPPHSAYLKISEGCDRTCSFCAIPLIRGPHVSLPVEILVEEAGRLAGLGVRELILVAQDLSFYGVDLERRPMLARLLKALLGVEGIDWIRLQYAYPHNFPDEVLRLMAGNTRICNYLDVPIQHISDRILHSMRRGHNRHATLGFLEKARRMVPGLALRTTLMVGYPGESQAEFDELLHLVKTFRFDRLGVFAYSPEEGTRAMKLADNVPDRVKQARARAIMDLQEGISLERNTARIGRLLRVMVDRREGSRLVGRTEHDSPEVDNEVFLDRIAGVDPGQFVTARITAADAYELFGHVVPGPIVP